MNSIRPNLDIFSINAHSFSIQEQSFALAKAIGVPIRIDEATSDYAILVSHGYVLRLTWSTTP